jgi:exonuclease-1
MYISNEDLFKDQVFKNMSGDMFLEFCILSGCDFFKLAGTGGRKALKYILKNKKFIDSGIKKEIKEDFTRAIETFKYQVVYCPLEKKNKHLHDLPIELINKNMNFLGII